MFDISWSEFLLIGVVALIVIGPKELPAVMRTLGQWTRKVRGMASEFQNQFQEAIREAEMADLKKEVDDLAQDVKNFDPLKEVRADVENMGEDVKRSLTVTPEPAAASDAGAETALSETPPEALPAAAEPAAIAAPEPQAPAGEDAQAEPAREMEPAATADAAKADAMKAADGADTEADSGTGRTG
jgi:sec-independent protein translocase protein TatB